MTEDRAPGGSSANRDDTTAHSWTADGSPFALAFWRGLSRHARGPRALSLADQALSGLSNFLAVALIARSATPTEFGHFAVAYALFIAFLGLARQLWGTRISLTPSGGEALRQLESLLGATAYGFPLAAVIMTVPSLLLAGWSAWSVILVLVLALPIVVAQDLCRYASVAADRPGVALISDLMWVVAVAIGFVFAPPIMLALGIWLGGALAALVVALLLLRVRPAFSDGWSALRRRHSTGEVSALGSVSTSLASYATLGLATVTLSAAAAGALRGASTVMAPVNTVFGFIGLAMLPVIHPLPRSVQRSRVMVVSVSLALLSVGWAGVLLLLPEQVGEWLLGETWGGARSVLPWTGLEYVGLGIAAGAVLGLQSLMAARLLAFVVLPSTALTALLALVAALIGDSVQAFAQALVAGAAVFGLLSWIAFLLHDRDSPTGE